MNTLATDQTKHRHWWRVLLVMFAVKVLDYLATIFAHMVAVGRRALEMTFMMPPHTVSVQFSWWHAKRAVTLVTSILAHRRVGSSKVAFQFASIEREVENGKIWM